MLVLTRKAREAIVIGESVRISIERIDGNRVKIGIIAPKAVKVRREELAPLHAA